MRFFSSIKILRVVLALTVALWMAGAGCLLGCENNIAAAASDAPLPNASTIVASGEACASSRGHDCCAKSRTSGARSMHGSNHHGVEPATRAGQKSTDANARGLASSLGTVPRSMESCPLAVNATAVLSKAGGEQSNPIVAIAQLDAPRLNSQLQTIALSSPLRLPNRGHTYLRCCVFLI
jgi:hypothetical protein